jgi:hydrogenase maturation protein HypF
VPVIEGIRIQVTGVVQGVGFRPFVHRLALRHGLEGWVRNESGEVEIALSGTDDALTQFLEELRTEAPPLARIDGVLATREVPRDEYEGFRILESGPSTDHRQPVPADVSMCDACTAEMSDPQNRRFRYPFITCTDCGPRYSVIEGLPYDRHLTSMRSFTQCAACSREYRTVGDRRYHSETNSCPACGPRLALLFPGEAATAAADGDPLATAAAYLRAGWIVALRGVGGFHLVADATSSSAVALLRSRKRRDARPLAVMVAVTEDAERLATIEPAERRALESPERPIVLLRARPDSTLAPEVAPGLDRVGVMLAYTPLHRLLLDAVGMPLVMTSGNLSEEPIAAAIDDAVARLGAVADVFLVHDREIVASVDDSVVRLAGQHQIVIRRGRGLAPLPVDIPVVSDRAIIAVGGHLKNTFTLAQGGRAYVSPHIGDLDSVETLEHFRSVLASYERLFRIRPDVVVRDLHPGYVSTRVAEELNLPTVVAVQHHHAHVAAVAAENGVVDPVIGLAFDGTGYGEDGHVWGAEVMIAELHRYSRVAQLRYSPLPGGDAAVKAPWRSALGYLSLDPGASEEFAVAFNGVASAERATAELQIDRKVNAPLASSMGRLFDAAAAILGVRRVARYEGQAAMELEALAGKSPGESLPFPFAEGEGGRLILDPLPLLAALGYMLRRGRSVADLAADFHASVEESVTQLVSRLSLETGITSVALGGGSFQNARLVSGLRRRLGAKGLRVLTALRLPCNDGGLSYGQAVVAAAVVGREGHPDES